MYKIHLTNTNLNNNIMAKAKKEEVIEKIEEVQIEPKIEEVVEEKPKEKDCKCKNCSKKKIFKNNIGANFSNDKFNCK